MRLLFFMCFLSSLSWGQNACQEYKKSSSRHAPIDRSGRSDSVDILHYKVSVDASSLAYADSLIGSTVVLFKPKMNGLPSLCLDLLKLDITQFKSNTPASYTYNDSVIKVVFEESLDTSKTYELTFHYRGLSQEDHSGWGGVHTAAPFYYNLGVGFDANPHSYGRSWHVCSDNFVEKATYEITMIRRHPELKTFANGTLKSTYNNSNYHDIWTLNQAIPSYLASFAICPYLVQPFEHKVPIEVAYQQTTNANVAGSFENVREIFDAFEYYFGEYAWDKLTYVLTPIGAMEHATSIHFPVSLVDGSKNGEDIIAHEMAHHWWGNLVTCATAGDMWINEGMAEWSSHLYREKVYGKEDYLNAVQANVAWVIKNMAMNDGGHYPIQDLPNNLTYGAHTYQKGAWVAHNLRGVMGDSLFFYGLQSILKKFAFKNLNVQEFQNELERSTGLVLLPFFDEWIYGSGYPVMHTDIVEIKKTKDTFITDLHIRQTTVGNDGQMFHVPANILAVNFKEGKEWSLPFNYSNDSIIHLKLPFYPDAIILNPSKDFMTANLYERFVIKEKSEHSTGQMNFRNNSKKASEVVVQKYHDTPIDLNEHSRDKAYYHLAFDKKSAVDVQIFKSGIQKVFYKPMLGEWSPIPFEKEGIFVLLTNAKPGYYYFQ